MGYYDSTTALGSRAAPQYDVSSLLQSVENLRKISAAPRDREVELYKFELAAKLDADRAEEQAWKREDRTKLLADRATEDKFNSIVSAGPTTMAGIITDSIDPSSYNKIALTDEEVKKAQAANWDTSKITSQSILDKLKGQQAISDYADAVPDTLKETRSQLLERAANETGSPTKEMLDRIDKAKAAEIAFATAYNKEQKGADTLSDLDNKMSDLRIKIGSEATSIQDKKNKIKEEDSDDSKSTSGKSSSSGDGAGGYIATREKVLGGNILTNQSRENDIISIENHFAALGITKDSEKNKVLNAMIQEGTWVPGGTFGDITAERIKRVDKSVNSDSKRFKDKTTYNSDREVSTAGLEAMQSELANLQAKRDLISTTGSTKLVSPRDAALARAKTDLNAILSRYGNVKDTTSTTAPVKQPDTIISKQDKSATLTNSKVKTDTTTSSKEPKNKVLASSNKTPTSKTILDVINDNKLVALAEKEKRVKALSKDTSARGLSLYKTEKANLERLKKSLQPSK